MVFFANLAFADIARAEINAAFFPPGNCVPPDDTKVKLYFLTWDGANNVLCAAIPTCPPGWGLQFGNWDPKSQSGNSFSCVSPLPPQQAPPPPQQ